ncbi:hypothetical protein D3C72_1647140 [compost metagenome]
MEFAVFAAGVDAGRQVGQEGSVELASAKCARQVLAIDAHDDGLEAGGEKFVDQRAAIPAPQRQVGRQAGDRADFFFPVAVRLQVDVAKQRVIDALGLGRAQHGDELLFVAGPAGVIALQARAQAGRLRGEQLGRHAVRARLAAIFIHGRDQQRHVHAGVARAPQGQAGILAAAPGNQGRRHFSTARSMSTCCMPSSSYGALTVTKPKD